ncbi:outer membrane beta-barrel protein [Bdellovibrio sp. NC01]|uniref:outer membrane beta-barrel protein n=1 Tax=Bdellovibrio sp. NC01 TaxID=2220073 RepID=UPI00115C1CA8|nr:outer membrane beta-barrel protein [Bdellovibrio sp. NC01]QDK36334.1 PorT family protein [Bdellovibrio sp. NC01]
MNKLILSVLLVLGSISSVAMADVDYGLEVGIRSQSGDADATGSSTTSQTAIQFGGIIHYPISGGWHIRSGMLYTQRPLIVKTSGSTVENKVSMNYLDVPVAIMYKFEDYAGIFGGVSLGMNLDKSCDAPNCVVTDVKTPILPFIFGASFKFAPQLGATIYFESYGDTVAKSPPDNLKNYRAVGANLLITFN